MAQLTEEQIADLAAKLQRLFSNAWTPINLDKTQLTTAITIFDAALESAETAILANVAAPAAAWLTANATTARFILENVATQRREDL